MSFVFDSDDAASRLTQRPQARKPSTLREVFGADRRASLATIRSISRGDNLRQAYDPIVERLNEGITDPESRVFNPYRSTDHPRTIPGPGQGRAEAPDIHAERLWQEVQRRREEDERLQDLPESREAFEQMVAQDARTSLEEADAIAAESVHGPILTTMARFGGGAAASFQDPAILGTMAFGAPWSAGIIRTALVEAGLAGATEAALQPAIASYRREMGLDYTAEDFFRNVAFSAGAGAVFGGAIRAVPPAVQQVRDRIGGMSRQEQLDEFDRVVTDPTPEQRAARSEQEAVQDVDGRNPIDDTPGAATREHHQRWQEAEQAAEQGTRPQGEEIPIDRRRAGIDDPQPTVVQVDPARIIVDPERFQFKGDATGPEGLTERLQGVRQWDESKAGLAMVWEDVDGRQFIADGHQRVGLARRLQAEGQDVRLNAIVLRETDGWTDVQARMSAAAKNIAEGTGTPVDTARILRDAGGEMTDPTLASLPPQSALVRQGRDLVNLSEDAFGAVVNELVPAHYGALVGRLVDDPQMQRSIMDLLAREQPANAQQAESMIRQAREAGFAARTDQQGLFGDDEISQLLFRERAQVLDRALRQLRRDKQAFRTLIDRARDIEQAGNTLARDANARRASTDAEAINVIQRLAHVRGPVSDALGAAARRAADEGRFDRATRDFVNAIRREAEDGNLDGSALGGTRRGAEPASEDAAVSPTPARAAEADRERLRGFEEPSGEAATRQAQDLDDELRPQAAPEAPARAVDEAREIADELGVDLFATERDGVLTIETMVVPEGRRGEGVGTEAMQALTAMADARGLRMALTPSSDLGGNVTRLRRFYQRHGFVNNRGRSRDHSISEAMIREPQELTPERQAVLDDVRARTGQQAEPARDVGETPDRILDETDAVDPTPETLEQLLAVDQDLFQQAAAARAERGLDPIETPEQAVARIQEDVQEAMQRPETFQSLPAHELRRRRNEAVEHLQRRGGYAEGEPRANIARQQRADIVLGPPAAGKSSALVDPLARQNRSIVIDADEAKQLLPEFDNGRGAHAVHEESSRIAMSLFERAIDAGDNIVYPKIGRSLDGIQQKVRELSAAGYSVHVHHVGVPPARTMQRMLLRYVGTGRALPPNYVANIGDAPRRTYDAIKESPDVAGFSRYDNNVAFGESPRAVESGYRAPDGRTVERGPGELARERDAGNPAQATEQVDLFASGGRHADPLRAQDPLSGDEMADMQVVVGERVDPETGQTVAETRTMREIFDEADADERFAREVEGCVT